MRINRFLLSVILAVIVILLPLPVFAHSNIEVADVDSNNDGIIDLYDFAAFVDSYGSNEDDPNYDRQFDMDFDGDVDLYDFVYFSGIYGADIDAIQSNIKTGNYTMVKWPNGQKCLLPSVNGETLKQFTGCNGVEGWISIIHHPYIPKTIEESGYRCTQFAIDTMTASYKGLGYGCLLYSESETHAYNVFWKGGDWTNLHNWGIIDLTYDRLYLDAAKVPIIYQSRYVYFPISSTQPWLKVYYLKVDYVNAYIAYGSFRDAVFMGCEEPMPPIFDTRKR